MTKRQKASDVFQESKLFLGEKVRFSRAFPEIESLNVAVTEKSCGFEVKTRHYSGESAGEYLDCSNRRCYGGGFQLGFILGEMNRNEESEKQFHFLCDGYEGSPKGRIRYGPCDHSFDVKVSVRYKSDKLQDK